jgi:hypothetical protein
MTHVPKNRSGVGSRCLPCNRRYKVRQERRLAAAPRDEDGNLIEPVEDVDPAPARRLVELLADSRRHGLAFEQAFAADCAFAVRELETTEQESWRRAFEATRSAWQAAWRREPDAP